MLGISKRLFTTCDLSKLVAAKSWEDIKAFTDNSPWEMQKFIAGGSYTAPNGITFSKIPSDREEDAFTVLARLVTMKEPIAVKLQMSEELFKKNVCKNLFKMSNYQDLSVMASDKDKVIGAFISLDWKNQKRNMPETPEDLHFWKHKMNPLVNFMLMYNATSVDTSKIVCHGITSGVEDHYTNRGVARNALAIRLALAKTLGFSEFMAEAGYGISNAYKVYKHYMEYATEMTFSDFEFENRRPFEELDGGYMVFVRTLE